MLVNSSEPIESPKFTAWSQKLCATSRGLKCRANEGRHLLQPSFFVPCAAFSRGGYVRQDTICTIISPFILLYAPLAGLFLIPMTALMIFFSNMDLGEPSLLKSLFSPDEVFFDRVLPNGHLRLRLDDS